MRSLIGHVIHYYNQIGVAAVDLIDDIKLGDKLLFLGHTTDLTQPVFSMEIKHHKITSAEPGMRIALKVIEPVRKGDEVYKLRINQVAPDNQEIWTLVLDAESAIVNHYEPVFKRFRVESKLDPRGVGLLLAAWTFEPHTITASRLGVRSPYTASSEFRRRLAEVAARGYLREVKPAEYRLTDQSLETINVLIKQGRDVMDQVDPLNPIDGQRLASLLGRLVQTCLDTPYPPDTWSIGLSYKMMPEPNPPLPYIEQAISCLSGYRDDAHMAAWRPSGLSAIALESLSILWKGSANSLATIIQSLAQRGHTPQNFREALVELRERGFLSGTDSEPELTQAGLSFRETVEQDTNRYFFKPWSCLSEADRTDLASLLTQLSDGLRTED